MDKILLGFAGPAGVGKDTAADLAADLFFPVNRMSFAYPIKAATEAMGITPEEGTLTVLDKEAVMPDIGKSMRHCWQTLGTEWGRELIHPDLWIILARRKWLAMKSGAMIFSDVRFENEAAWIRSEGLLIHIEGPARRELDEKAKGHASEGGLERFACDAVIANDGSLTELGSSVALEIQEFVNRKVMA